MAKRATPGQALAMSPKEVLEIMTRECRDLLDNIADRTVDSNGIQFAHPTITDLTPEERSEIVREHFAMDNSGYGISIEEWLPGISEEDRIEIVNEVLANPEYTS